MKDPKKSYRPIKLRAIDDNDLSVFSDCIYQSILLSSELMYDQKTKIFLFNRCIFILSYKEFIFYDITNINLKRLNDFMRSIPLILLVIL